MIGQANSVRHIGLDLSRSSESDTVTKRRPVVRAALVTERPNKIDIRQSNLTVMTVPLSAWIN